MTGLEYGSTTEDWWANLVLDNMESGAGLEVDNRAYNDMGDATIYTSKGITGTLLNDYHNVLVVAPSDVYIHSDDANMGSVLGFSGQSHVSPTTTTASADLFTSPNIPVMKSNTSLFVRINNLNFNSYNAGNGNRSKILYSLPRFAQDGSSAGTGLYFEPNERLYLPLNNPADITINEFSIDIVNENETLATDLTGKSVVIFHIRKRANY